MTDLPAPIEAAEAGKRSTFTIVFDGDISDLPFNPFLMDSTPFGLVVAVGAGNAFEDIETLEARASSPQTKEG